MMNYRKIITAAVLIASISLVALAPSVRAAVAGWLQVFRMEQVQIIKLSADDMARIEQGISESWEAAGLDFTTQRPPHPHTYVDWETVDIEGFGRMEQQGGNERQALNASELESLAFPVRLPELGADESVNYWLDKVPQIVIYPDLDDVNLMLQSMGSEHLLPDELAGKSFTVTPGDRLTITTDRYVLVQGPVIAITTDAAVDDVAELYQTVAALPIWPDSVKRQLLAVKDWQNTIPLLLPEAEGLTCRQVDVNGVPALLAESMSGRMLVWQEAGSFFMVQDCTEGALDLPELAATLK